LLLIAGVVFCYMLFFADSGEAAVPQAMLMGATVTVVVATLLAINALNNPYHSPAGSIKPTAMEQSLRVLDEARATLGSKGRLPCNAQGAAAAA
jgi:multisubunit Na+/H+ antiporter MnhB subunit